MSHNIRLDMSQKAKKTLVSLEETEHGIPSQPLEMPPSSDTLLSCYHGRHPYLRNS